MLAFVAGVISMDRIYTKSKYFQAKMPLWVVVASWIFLLVFIAFQGRDALELIAYPATISILWIVNLSASKVGSTYLLFGEESLVFGSKYKVDWYIPYERLFAVKKEILAQSKYFPAKEEILFLTNDGDSYSMPGRTLSNDQIETIRNKIENITRCSKTDAQNARAV